MRGLLSILALGTTARAVLPQPFSRTLRITTPPLNGSDVTILQNLLQRAGTCSAPSTGAYDAATARAVSCAQHHWGINGTNDGGFGVFGNATAWRCLESPPLALAVLPPGTGARLIFWLLIRGSQGGEFRAISTVWVLPEYEY